VRALLRGLEDVPDLARPATGRVRGLVQPGASVAPLGDLAGSVELVTGDLLEPASLDPFVAGAKDAVLVVATGLIHPRLRVRDLERVNVEGTRQLLEKAAGAGVKRAVVISSNSPFGVSGDPSCVLDESAPYRPYLAYGRSKMRMEEVTREIGSRRGLETVILRVPWFYGPNQPARQTLFFSMILRGSLPFPGNGANRRSMGYVDNTAQAILLAAREPRAAGRAYWIADERPYTMNEIVETVEDVLERDFGRVPRRRRLRVPRFVHALARLADRSLQAVGLYHEKVHVLGELDRTIACSIDLARKELGYRPAVALREGMRRSIEDVLRRGLVIA
jgi:nucleoside-diphosphate-sugar epimerase